ncbi:MAG: hypothetical protein ACXWWU_02935 [Candidatus Limnocylindria bacterium]
MAPRSLAAAMLALVLLAGCGLFPSPTPSPEPSLEPTPTAEPTPSPAPTPTEEPGLRLPAPATSDRTAITYTVTVEVEAAASGRVVVVVTNLSQTRVPELVLRWPTAVKETVFLAPFEPSQQRIREGGDPLVQAWTKWVDGPGEHAEPAGTTSLGWGPLLAGGTLTIPILATRVAPGPLTFDLQILNGEKILTGDGAPAWTQVTVP